MGRGEKTGTSVVFSNEVGAPVAGVVMHQGGKEEGVRHSYTRGKRKQGGGGVLGAPAEVVEALVARGRGATSI
jgi:hypothetical protein